MVAQNVVIENGQLTVGNPPGGSTTVSSLVTDLAVNASVVGTNFVSVGVVYLGAGTILASKSFLWMGVDDSVNDAEVELRNAVDGTLLATITKTGIVGSASPATDIVVATAGHYAIRLRADTANVTAFLFGLHLVYRGSDPIWRWNETDLSQISLVSSAPSTNGSLSVATQPFDPYRPTITSTHTSGTSGGWKFYKFLDDDGNDLDLPTRYEVMFRLGPRNSPHNGTPGFCPYFLDIDHLFYMHRDSASPTSVRFFCQNGDDLVASASPPGNQQGTLNLLLANTDNGVFVQMLVDTRELSVSNDPAGSFWVSGASAQGTYVANLQGSSIWTPFSGGNDPDTAWDAGWNVASPQIGAGVMFYENAGTNGSIWMAEMCIRPHPLDR